MRQMQARAYAMDTARQGAPWTMPILSQLLVGPGEEGRKAGDAMKLIPLLLFATLYAWPIPILAQCWGLAIEGYVGIIQGLQP